MDLRWDQNQPGEPGLVLMATGYHVSKEPSITRRDRTGQVDWVDKWFVAAEPGTVNHIPGAAMLTALDLSREPT